MLRPRSGFAQLEGSKIADPSASRSVLPGNQEACPMMPARSELRQRTEPATPRHAALPLRLRMLAPNAEQGGACKT